MSGDPVQDLDDAAVRRIVRKVRTILWFDLDHERWDCWKEWNQGTIEAVASVFSDAGLCPSDHDGAEVVQR